MSEEEKLDEEKFEFEVVDKEKLEKEKLKNEIKILQKENASFAQNKLKNRRNLIFAALISGIPTIGIAILAVFTLFLEREKAIVEHANSCLVFFKEYDKLKNDTTYYKLYVVRRIKACYPEEETKFKEEEERIVERIGDLGETVKSSNEKEQKVKDNPAKSGASDATKANLGKDKIHIPNMDSIAEDTATLNRFEDSYSISTDEETVMKNSSDSVTTKQILSDSKLVENIQKIESDNIKIALEEEKLRHKEISPIYTKQYWVKQGYFVNTKLDGEDARIYLVKMNELGKSCSLLIEVGGKKYQTDLSDKDRISSYSTGSFKYEIIYSNISYAGKNPFKKALYFTFQKYNLRDK